MVNAPEVHPLKKWRKSEGLTLEEAAARLDGVRPDVVKDRPPTSRQVWSDWERGRRRPSSDTMTAVYVLTGGAVQPNDFYDLPQTGMTAHLPEQAAA